MRVYLLIMRYPWWAIPFGILSMALFRLPLSLNKRIRFWKLMGSGRNGSFDLTPDLRQWGLIIAYDEINTKNPLSVKSFIRSYLDLFRVTSISYELEPIEGHGLWDGKEVFGKLPKQTEYAGEIAVLTRATIRLTKLTGFWRNVPAVSKHMPHAKGLLASYGIGEIPFIKQATFSIWESKDAMKQFAYALADHKEVIRKTNKQHWYTEEMFVRFRIRSIERSALSKG